MLGQLYQFSIQCIVSASMQAQGNTKIHDIVYYYASRSIRFHNTRSCIITVNMAIYRENYG
jgi:hypothetical protein